MKIRNFPLKRILPVLLIMVCFTPFLMPQQQNLNLPKVSQEAVVSQTIGYTTIKIHYHSPLVKNRVIWGKLVPFDQVWRMGANENTLIYFSDDVTINGILLSKGKYGLHAIPSETEWTIIFSKNNWSWGSFSYDQSEDAHRIKVKPESVPFQEWLSYSLDDPTANSVVATMHWEKIKVSFKIEIEQHKLALENFTKQLESLPKFFWQGWNQAASYCLINKVNTEQGLAWVEQSIKINKNFTNLYTKAGLLDLKGNSKEAKEIRNNAFNLGNEAQINTAGYQFLFSGKTAEALEIFKLNMEKFPNSWNVYDSYAEALLAIKDNVGAKKYYEKALRLVTDDTNKTRIKNILANMK